MFEKLVVKFQINNNLLKISLTIEEQADEETVMYFKSGIYYVCRKQFV